MTAKNDTPKSELLPCPFCGGIAEKRYYQRAESYRFVKFHFIKCKTCGAQTKEARTLITPLKNWNRRA